MSKNIAHKFGQGITPEQFMDGMTKNQDTFKDYYAKFEWPSHEDQEFFESLNNRDDLRCLILAADWCGDVVRNIPVVFRSLEKSGIPVEVMIKEQHEDLMEDFLILGGKSIPVVIIADTGGYVLGQWGPRPAHIQEVMVQFKQDNPDRGSSTYEDNLAAARQEIMRRYGEGTDYQASVVRELRELLSTF